MVSQVHRLSTDIIPPERFTYPFCYEPHPLCILAAEEVKREIERIQPKEGKMFGVLVVREESGDRSQESEGNRFGFLAAYSGLLEGRNDWKYFVPPVFDAQQPDGYFKTKEREIMQSEEHRQMSQDLQLWLFQQYRMLNAKGEVKDLVDIWQDYHRSPRIRNKYPLPPGGTGD
ncbi:MAG: hypothetical protein J6W05_06575, partial [Prevotella sp.]|nr:hypothetical protein [Prevotella sp.]